METRANAVNTHTLYNNMLNVLPFLCILGHFRKSHQISRLKEMPFSAFLLLSNGKCVISCEIQMLLCGAGNLDLITSVTAFRTHHRMTCSNTLSTQWHYSDFCAVQSKIIKIHGFAKDRTIKTADVCRGQATLKFPYYAVQPSLALEHLRVKNTGLMQCFC